MKKMYCLLFFCLIAGSMVTAQELIFKATIKDVDTMMVLCRGIVSTDTLYTTNGHFVFKKRLALPELYTIICIKGQQSISALREGNERKMRSKEDGISKELFFENGTATVSCNFADFGNTDVIRKPCSAQALYDEFRKRFNPLVKIARTIIDSSYTLGKTESGKKIFGILYNRVEQVENETSEKFAIEKSENIAGAYVLYRYCRINDGNRLDSIYQLFSPSLRSSAYLKNIKQKISALLALKQGKPAPFFSATAQSLEKINLSQYKGMFVVLDFWGSWCIPCIQGLPKMKEYYNRYYQKVSFIGIACNDKPKDLKNVVNQYGLAWPQVMDNTDLGLASKYNIEAYPTKVIIDPNGNFVQAFQGESIGFYQKLDELLSIQQH